MDSIINEALTAVAPLVLASLLFVGLALSLEPLERFVNKIFDNSITETKRRLDG